MSEPELGKTVPMSFSKRQVEMTISAARKIRDVSVTYITKSIVDDEIDEEILYTEALSQLGEGENYDVVCFRDGMWFGVTGVCSSCVYVDFNDEEGLDAVNAYKFVDTRCWLLKTGFSLKENPYIKIVITSTKSPESLFDNDRRWLSVIGRFKVVTLE